MQQKYIVTNHTSSQIDEFKQKLLMMEYKLFLNTVYCIKTGNQKRANLLAHEISYVRQIKKNLAKR